jgi:hypothetical protein
MFSYWDFGIDVFCLSVFVHAATSKHLWKHSGFKIFWWIMAGLVLFYMTTAALTGGYFVQ